MSEQENIQVIRANFADMLSLFGQSGVRPPI